MVEMSECTVKQPYNCFFITKLSISHVFMISLRLFLPIDFSNELLNSINKIFWYVCFLQTRKSNTHEKKKITAISRIQNIKRYNISEIFGTGFGLFVNNMISEKRYEYVKLTAWSAGWFILELTVRWTSEQCTIPILYV